MGELVESVPNVVLAVYAHPNDADVSCGGTLAYWASRGSEVHLLVCTDGAKGTTQLDLDTSTFATTRAIELRDAASALNLSSHSILGYRDGDLTEGEALREELVAWVRRVRPDSVLGHDPTAVFFGQEYFNHRDHRVAGWALLDAIAPAAGLPHYFPDAGPPHQVGTVYLSGTLQPDVWVDIGSTIETKVEAVLCHRSQLDGHGSDTNDWMRESVIQRAREAGGFAGVEFAEGFRRVQLLR
ncbi:MAG: PIG-L family deacetylase [Actinobacteria bacterium]|nr:PIG-L family deacetylase [Actinomycetota bacterium]MCL5445709.1 PIG-L family deacetylase [Actinomycetota bacterium]